MNTKQHKGSKTRQPVKVIVAREFSGSKTIGEAFIPVIVEDIRRKAEQIRTFDSSSDTS